MAAHSDIPSRDSFPGASNGVDFQNSILHSHHYKQSSHIPRTLYNVMCTVFQVPVSENDRCVVGKIVFGFIVLISTVYGGLDILFTIYDIKSEKTKQTVTTGLFNIFITVLWCALGIYAHRLGKRIMKSTSFVNSLRLHSKTVFKIPAIVLLMILSLAVVSISSYGAFKFYWSMSNCTKIELPAPVCRIIYVSRLIQNAAVVIFNCCVAGAVMSICRTHTIGVRRFIRALESDGQTCEMKHRQRFQKMQFAASHNLSEMYLPEECYKAEDSDETDSIDERDDDKDTLLRTYIPSSRTEAAVSSTTDPGQHPAMNSRTGNLRPSLRPGAPAARNGHILSKDDILFSYWKLASRMRMTSQVLQRWTASWISFTLLWLLKWILLWLSHPTEYLEIAQFIIPLVMIIIICSGYSEANGETARIIWSITPLQDRLDLIRSLPNIQIGMTLYNARIEYSSILTVLAAIGLALSSRMILDEFLPPSPHS